MPNRHINANISKAMSPATGLGISQDSMPPHTVTSSLKPANKRLDSLSPLYK